MFPTDRDPRPARPGRSANRCTTVTTSNLVWIRPLVTADLGYVVSEHQASLPDGVYARLGARFLHAHHSAYLTSPGTAAFVGEFRGTPVSFVTGVVSAAPHRLPMRRAWPYPEAASIDTIPQRPLKVARGGFRPVHGQHLHSAFRLLRPGPAADPTTVRTGILTYLAVAAAARGHGVGDAPLNAFLHRAREQRLRQGNPRDPTGPAGSRTVLCRPRLDTAGAAPHPRRVSAAGDGLDMAPDRHDRHDRLRKLKDSP